MIRVFEVRQSTSFQQSTLDSKHPSDTIAFMATSLSTAKTLSQYNYILIKLQDRLTPHSDVRRAQSTLINSSIVRNRWDEVAKFNEYHPALDYGQINSYGVCVTAVANDIGLVKPWYHMEVLRSPVPSSPARLRLMDNISPTTASVKIDVESDLHDEEELTCKPELLRDGVVGPVSLANAGVIYNYLFKSSCENGRFVGAETVTTAIVYAVSYKHEVGGDASMCEADFIRIVKALKAVHPREPVFIWIDQQLRKCPERGEWINRGVAPYIAFPTVRLAHLGPERVWIALEKTAAARHCVRIDVSTDPNHVTLVINSPAHHPKSAAMDAIAGFLCGDLVTTFGITYKSDLVKLRNWAKNRFKSLSTPRLCSLVNYGTRAYFTGGRRATGWRTTRVNCWSPTPLNSVGLGRRGEMTYKGQRFVRAEFNCFVLSGKGYRTTAFLLRMDEKHVKRFVTVNASFAAFLDFAVEEYHMPCDLTAKHLLRCDNGAVERVGRLLEVRWMSSCEFDGLG